MVNWGCFGVGIFILSVGAGEGTRTPTALRPLGPKPSASTSSATPALMEKLCQFTQKNKLWYLDLVKYILICIPELIEVLSRGPVVFSFFCITE